MKSARWLFSMTIAALVGALLCGVYAQSAHADEELWQTDYKAALAKAKAEKKYVLADFTGSDWCGWCIKLHNEVFEKEPFKAEAPKNYVLLELDYPQKKKQPEELKKQNAELSEKYKIEGYPSVLLLDAEGQVIARTGYAEGGPEPYLKQLAEFGTIYQNVVALKGKLNGIAGLDRAKLLDQIVDGYKKLGNESDEVAAWAKEIVTLDPDNKAGLKVKYEFPTKMEEAEKVAQAGDFAKAKELFDTALALPGVPAEMKQEGYMAKAQVCAQQHKYVEVLAAFNAAKEAAPESASVKRIDAYIKQVSKIAESEAAADKLEAEVAKAEGMDRAKLLDKLIDAKQKMPADPEGAKNIAKWSKEIVALDPDNKAGLKQKYAVKSALTEAMQLAQSGKVDDAIAALDKVLELPGISAEDTQRALFLKAQIRLSHNGMKEGIAFLKKALDAAPQSELAPMLKQGIAQLENAKKPESKTEE